ncbi:MAG: PilZ domain-containing protein [Candidatus Omnitrophica bacterium]|nr:PilZ domain-containing protein [Candidatus Omnitrophota bacterium]
MEKDDINKRRFIRIEFPFTVHVNVPQGNIISTYVENISEGGIKVIMKEELKPSDLVDLKIYVKETPIECRGRVVWVEPRQSRFLEEVTLYHTGIELRDVNPKDLPVLKERVVRLLQETKEKD